MIKHTFLSLFKDLKAFNGIKNGRLEAIEKAPTDDVEGVFGVNMLADILHPDSCEMKVIKAVRGEDGAFIVLEKTEGEVPAYKAGQFAVIKKCGEENIYPRAYFIVASADSTVTLFIHDGSGDVFSEGRKILLTLPWGHTYYMPLRDSEKIYLLCDNDGIGAEKAFRNDGFLSERTRFLTCSDDASLRAFTEKAKSEGASVFAYGSEEFICKVSEAVKDAGIIPKFFRAEIITPKKALCERREFVCTVSIFGESRKIPCFSDETIAESLHNAGIPVNIKCMSGTCGYCRMKLLSGEIKEDFPCDGESLRMADIKYLYIHPCRSYPLTDISLYI